MKNKLIPLFALWVSAAVSAQTMERQAVGSGGGSVLTAVGSLHWTCGEMAIAPRVALNVYWGEGFQQSWAAPTVPTQDPEAAPEAVFAVFPNPAADHLRVQSDVPLQAQLFDLSGRAVSRLQAVNGLAELDLSHLPAGFYLLRLYDERGRIAGASKVQHVR